ncbi:hypothetical protein IE81DRAFT_169328 [Ceraceosorus guamensis]|uniref:Uncharacterized protein n=1 Tax=Ceraceosorus guamensis TaxID=1522189 RepID=A0A316VW00_9BASI|nr:hypothetical protein IE81DRAFT_169328 [Ceraceosorus guamensis]PWN41622.1 hypothetical protein IE81DRAFT_169328 [Ceraceosorus guamensis]
MPNKPWSVSAHASCLEHSSTHALLSSTSAPSFHASRPQSGMIHRARSHDLCRRLNSKSLDCAAQVTSTHVTT